VLDIGYKKKDNYKCIWLARVVEMVVIVRRAISTTRANQIHF